MNFKDIISESFLYNFHSHTQFCDGHAPMEDFARAAVEAGFTHYGFSPHSPVPIESPCNMAMSDVPLFLAEVNRLQKIYEGKIKFYAAMEIDYLGSEWGPANPYFRNLPLDYRIGSVHFVPNREGVLVDIDGKFESFKNKMNLFFDNDIRYVVDTFFRQTRQMLLEGSFDIVGHLDKIAQNASLFSPGIDNEKWFESQMVECLELVKQGNYTLEINTKAGKTGRLFPDKKWFPLIKALDINVLINSDAHQPLLINASRPETLSLFTSAPPSFTITDKK